MAKNTNLDIRQMTFYQVFPRQFSNKQNFEGIIDDLDRIKGLGIDVLYLLPIHPLGIKSRKGLKGSPYSIYDYYAINSEYGTLEDFKKLISLAHEKGLKVMMDIVINHTSRDSILTKEHPEWFYHNEKGEFANRIGDWSDITDLDYTNKEVWTYMSDMLYYWAQLVDGFRCDVAPLIPLDFWIEARQRIETLDKSFIWLTESVHPGFIKYLRSMDYDCFTDSEMYQAFDVCYDYDIFDYMYHYLDDPSLLNEWIEAIKRQETMYPRNYIKLRSFENHDQKRLRFRTRDEAHFIQMLTFQFFLKGPSFIYNGMEHQATHEPSLFDDDLIIWDESKSVEPLIKKLITLKKDALFRDGHFNIENQNGAILVTYEKDDEYLLGIFNLEDQPSIKLDLKDGVYANIFNQKPIEVKQGKVILDHEPMMIRTKKVYKQ
ncbi:MAG: alpha-amylase family glycosyl hydrolase [Acholeplasmataceae bacterium]